MPNHVTNQVRISGRAESLAQLKARLFSPGEAECGDDAGAGMIVDFNALVPMPEPLDVVNGSLTHWMLQWNAIDKTLPASALEDKHPFFYGKLTEYAAELIDWQKDTLLDVERLLRKQNELARKCGIDLDYGDTVVNNIRLYGYPTWYEWRCHHWGTKWNAYHQHIGTFSETEIYVEFDTAWSPPTPVFDVIAQEYPDLQLEVRYIDEGGGFAGTFVGESGELTDEPCPNDEVEIFGITHFGWILNDETD